MISSAPAALPGRLSFQPSLLIERLENETDLSCATLYWHDLIAAPQLDDTASLARARQSIDWLVSLKLSRSRNAYDPDLTPDVPFVLVLDQPAGAETPPSAADMAEMLVFAQTEILNAHVVILTCEGGVFSTSDDPRLTILPAHANLYRLLESATAVYTHSSGYGFDAILAGHRPRVFGQPWYSSLGLTEDETPNPHSTLRLTRAQLFLAAVIQATTWHSGETNLDLEDILARLEARDRAAREDAPGYIASGILRWKRRFLRSYLGRTAITFSDSPQTITQKQNAGLRHIAWGAAPTSDLRLEDGFLRSRGLGAALVRPLSLVLDDKGIYFDPTRPSALEEMITARATLTPGQRSRIERFIDRMKALHLSKYNVGATLPALPEGHRILVAGQVEDDASITLGAGEISTNLSLLQAARTAHPDAILIYKPHPDVEAGLRRGKVHEAAQIADVIAKDSDPLALIDACDEVWTMTSLIGFEALMRGKPVTCTGTPFYAGWGLTTDLGAVPARRAARPDLMALAHAVLIDYPRYFDPKTGAPLSPEEALEYLAQSPKGRSRLMQNLLAKLRQIRAATLGLS
ncbi:capsular polysaccharide biosynthesis protein [Celeribacter sp. ULVN23_4]